MIYENVNRSASETSPLIHHIDFRPAFWLRSPHAQTMLGSYPTRHAAARWRASELLSIAREVTITTADGTRLQAWLSMRGADAPRGNTRPLIIILHGWLGGHDATYVLSAAGALWAAGFDIARLNLRDHGGTDHWNADMFHSARIDEVVTAVTQLIDQHGGNAAGVLGYSLGGNFALRIALAASHQRVAVGTALAISPLIDPANSMTQLDRGSIIYRQYFMDKWHAALDAKAAAFPGHYDFSPCYGMRGVAALTDYFVLRHTEFATPRDYFRRYTLTGDFLSDLSIPTSILIAQDDPVIPFDDFARINPNSHLNIAATRHGGHCSFIEDLRGACFADRFIVAHFAQHFSHARQRTSLSNNDEVARRENGAISSRH